jgi:16S rRNA (guanine1207-N2)-methyltransferase
MSHYYTDNKELDSHKEQFEYYFDNEVFRFTTDIGVFSKENVDYGSYVLLKTVYRNNLGKKLLDLGSGYGPIGIILKRFNPELDVEMVDVNSRAVELAILNCKNNETDIKVHLCEDILELENQFDTIVLNPPIRAGKAVIYSLYEKAKEKLNENGHLYIVIRKAQGAMSSKKKLETLFNKVELINRDSGYLVFDSYN